MSARSIQTETGAIDVVRHGPSVSLRRAGRERRRVLAPRALAGLLALVMATFLAWAGSNTARAERYLSIEEVQKLCFPTATEFDAQWIKLGADDARRVQQKTGLRVRTLRNRLWVARRGESILGVLIFDQVIGKHELIDYAVAISPSGAVLQVEVMEYRESHGSAIRGAKWRAQFAGKSASSPLKLNDDIYNISGATISCRSITEGVKQVLAIYELVGRPRLLAADELPDCSRTSNN